MKNTTIGVDTSLQATYIDPSNPIATVVVDNVTASTAPADSGPYKFVPTVDYTVHQVVIPSLRKLLAKMLSTTDASVPNKDQNRAIKKIVREAFDDVYFEVLRGAFPDVSFGKSVGSYAIEPEPDKKSNIAL